MAIPFIMVYPYLFVGNYSSTFHILHCLDCEWRPMEHFYAQWEKLIGFESSIGLVDWSLTSNFLGLFRSWRYLLLYAGLNVILLSIYQLPVEYSGIFGWLANFVGFYKISAKSEWPEICSGLSLFVFYVILSWIRCDLLEMDFIMSMRASSLTKQLLPSKHSLFVNRETGKLGCKPTETLIEVNQRLGDALGEAYVDKSSYQRLVGKPIYLSHNRSDITYAVGVVIDSSHAYSDHERKIGSYLNAIGEKFLLIYRPCGAYIVFLTILLTVYVVTPNYSSFGYLFFLLMWIAEQQLLGKTVKRLWLLLKVYAIAVFVFIWVKCVFLASGMVVRLHSYERRQSENFAPRHDVPETDGFSFLKRHLIWHSEKILYLAIPSKLLVYTVLLVTIEYPFQMWGYQAEMFPGQKHYSVSFFLGLQVYGPGFFGVESGLRGKVLIIVTCIPQHNVSRWFEKMPCNFENEGWLQDSCDLFIATKIASNEATVFTRGEFLDANLLLSKMKKSRSYSCPSLKTSFSRGMDPVGENMFNLFGLEINLIALLLASFSVLNAISSLYIPSLATCILLHRDIISFAVDHPRMLISYYAVFMFSCLKLHADRLSSLSGFQTYKQMMFHSKEVSGLSDLSFETKVLWTFLDYLRLYSYCHLLDLVLALILITGTLEYDILHLGYLEFALVFFRIRLQILKKKNSIFKFLRIYNFALIVLSLAYRSPFLGGFCEGECEIDQINKVIGLHKYGFQVTSRFEFVEVIIFILISLQSYMFSSLEFDYVSKYIEAEKIGALVREQEKKAAWKTAHLQQIRKSEGQKRMCNLQVEMIKSEMLNLLIQLQINSNLSQTTPEKRDADLSFTHDMNGSPISERTGVLSVEDSRQQSIDSLFEINELQDTVNDNTFLNSHSRPQEKYLGKRSQLASAVQLMGDGVSQYAITTSDGEWTAAAEFSFTTESQYQETAAYDFGFIKRIKRLLLRIRNTTEVLIRNLTVNLPSGDDIQPETTESKMNKLLQILHDRRCRDNLNMYPASRVRVQSIERSLENFNVALVVFEVLYASPTEGSSVKEWKRSLTPSADVTSEILEAYHADIFREIRFPYTILSVIFFLIVLDRIIFLVHLQLQKLYSIFSHFSPSHTPSRTMLGKWCLDKHAGKFALRAIYLTKLISLALQAIQIRYGIPHESNLYRQFLTMKLSSGGARGVDAILVEPHKFGAKACKFNFCEHCVLGKQKRVKFGTTIHNTKDDFSRRVWVYPMKSKDEESKLNPRAKKAFFVGITHGVKGFRLWCLDTKKIICSRDVTFDESALVKKVTNEAVQTICTPQQVQTQEPLETPEPLAVIRPRREIRRPVRFVDMVAYALPVVVDDIPVTYQEVILSLESKRAIGCKWVFVKKDESYSKKDVRYKARLIAKGYAQKEGIDYNEVFSPVVKHSSIRILLALVAQLNLELAQLDVKMNFLHVGSLMYVMVCTRPDISQAVGVVSRYMHDPGEGHWKAVKWILGYLQQTVDVGLVFEQDETLAPLSCKSTLQSTVALSTTEAEYMAVSEAVKEAIWLNGLMEDLRVVQSHISLYCDSQSAIHLAKNQVYHSRTKHIDMYSSGNPTNIANPIREASVQVNIDTSSGRLTLFETTLCERISCNKVKHKHLDLDPQGYLDNYNEIDIQLICCQADASKTEREGSCEHQLLVEDDDLPTPAEDIDVLSGTGCFEFAGPVAIIVSEETPQGILGDTLSKFSIWALYITFVLAVGRFIRLQCSDHRMRIQFENLPSCDRLLAICEDIYAARAEGELEVEEVLYWTLGSIYRSPHMLLQYTKPD
ncbi:hypothetical protein F3Y22_tig00110393pilonHSYRG00191 [Hibiscus syriacus]|uniref:Piezo non-specific cation channel R-Ras-binding domain-containing protein n=1 Tax=Hibiscus syriacus TaxID=106335 RepID=A0A6A3AQF2_HIBSY|nr:hypothetical protein F3Y22_tig00110393pilonHSYRG00191 [Hibiscus syriacus]